MNINNKLFIAGLILLVILSVSVVSAADNTTKLDESSSDTILNNNNAVISADDYSSYYESDKQLVVKVKDQDDYYLDNVGVDLKYNNGVEDFAYTVNGYAYFDVFQKIGSQKATISINDDEYTASPVKINIKITKAPVQMIANKITTKANDYATLKVTVKDNHWNSIDEGTVKFIIDGKTYKISVKNGVATKKVKLTKAKTYTYKAFFSSTHYKSGSVSSSVVVKKAPKKESGGHYIKKGKYSFKVSDIQYKRIQYVKKHEHTNKLSTYAHFKVKTFQYHNGEPVYAIVKTRTCVINGIDTNFPYVQFVVMYGKEPWEWEYLTNCYRI